MTMTQCHVFFWTLLLQAALLVVAVLANARKIKLDAQRGMTEVLQDNGASVMAALLQETRIADVLDNRPQNKTNSGVTLLMPSDTAMQDVFAQLSIDQEDMENAPDMPRVLMSHVLAEGAMTVGELQDKQMLEPADKLFKASLLVEKLGNGETRVEGASVIVADLIAGNNIIHIIDQPLLTVDELRASGALVPNIDAVINAIVGMSYDDILRVCHCFLGQHCVGNIVSCPPSCCN